MDGEHAATVEYLREWLARAGLEPDPEQPCSYLPDQLARSIAFKASSLPPGFYHALMDLNFRRSGRVLYSPRCARCRQCQAIRLPVGDFRPNRSQKRCRQRNQDVTVSVAIPVLIASGTLFTVRTCKDGMAARRVLGGRVFANSSTRVPYKRWNSPTASKGAWLRSASSTSSRGRRARFTVTTTRG